ncbi:hypothetical protein [Moorena producens]|uniref:hypothetical protein n=1 Tax=Moorena producens TaxID=1155739 RepID=UPI0014180C2E|nr:hypothetical protein [Moorena sp. SIO4A3]
MNARSSGFGKAAVGSLTGIGFLHFGRTVGNGESGIGSRESSESEVGNGKTYY